MVNRRQFLGAISFPAAVSFAAPELAAPASIERVLRAFADSEGSSPEDAAQDEDLWREVQQAFTCDRTRVNLNNGGCCPSPAVVQEAMARHLAFSNDLPTYNLWQVLEPQREPLRQRLARQWDCDPEELAFTRNASEGLEICQLGFDLAAGDEVLTSNQDYPRMLTTFKQRERRDKIVLKQISLPVPCEDDDEILRRFEKAITPRTKLILICHVINLTGQILPVKRLAALGKQHNIPVIVDGAHAFAHLDFKLSDLGCDYYATSLHKWLYAPHGTGLLYVRRDKIRALWPMMPAPDSLDDDIRKFEEIGTHPAANTLAIAEALTFHQGLGPARKVARLYYLRDRWAKRLLANERVKLNTSLDRRFGSGMGNVRVDGVDTGKLQAHLWAKHRIWCVAILHPEFEGLRITPSVHTTLEEIDRFCDAIEQVLKNGLPPEKK